MQLIRDVMTDWNHATIMVFVRADRHQLAHLRWRTEAEDGQEFGFDLHTPVQHGDVIFDDGLTRYVVEQLPEAVLDLAFDTVESAARTAWAVGNLHQPLQVIEGGIRTIDDPVLRKMFDSTGTVYRAATARFLPQRSTMGHGHHHHHASDDAGILKVQHG